MITCLCGHLYANVWLWLVWQPLTCWCFIQAKAIRSLGCTAEAVTVGHNPYSKASAMDRSIVLPTTRHRLCSKVQLGRCSLFLYVDCTLHLATACLLHQLADQLVDADAWRTMMMTRLACHPNYTLNC